MLILGTDPGVSGGLAVVDSRTMTIRWGMRMPTFKHRTKTLVDVPQAFQFLELMDISQAVIENVHSMPGQGHTGAFTFGRATGAAEALAMMVTDKLEWVSPTVWKKHFGLSKDKQASIDLARTTFGASYHWTHKADDGIAEAALLCRWYLDRRAKMD